MLERDKVLVRRPTLQIQSVAKCPRSAPTQTKPVNRGEPAEIVRDNENCCSNSNFRRNVL